MTDFDMSLFNHSLSTATVRASDIGMIRAPRRLRLVNYSNFRTMSFVLVETTDAAYVYRCERLDVTLTITR